MKATTEEEHRYIMETNHQYILDSLQCATIVDYMWQEGAIDHDQLDDLTLEGQTNKQKNSKLLSMMSQRSGSFDIFLKALDKDSKFLSDRLRATDMRPYHQKEEEHQQSKFMKTP